MGKQLKYNLAIFFSILDLLVIMAGIAMFGMGLLKGGTWYYCVPGVVLAFIGLILWYPARNWRVATRRDVEYDEFGVSKSKGNYEHLSKKERDQIDLKKTADMERLLSATALKKMTKKGSVKPMEDLHAMIGLMPVKQKVEEMVARMQFEQEEIKLQKGKKKNMLPMGSMGGRHMCFTGSPGTGKAQPLYSKVLTPNGFIKMGDIKVGDWVVTPNGDNARVLGVFPQGIKSIYEIKFKDGGKCRCSDEHLWKVQTRQDRLRHEYRIIQLKDMLDNVVCEEYGDSRANYSIELVRNINFPEKDFFIKPYTLGALLGDGSFTGKHGTSIGFTTADSEIINKMIAELPEGLQWNHTTSKIRPYQYRLSKIDTNETAKQNKNKYIEELQRLGLFGAYSDSKFIPKEYLTASFEQRLEVLRGLLDTDGSISTKAEIRFSTASAQLAQDVMELIRSLGGVSYHTIKPASYKNVFGEKVLCKPSHSITVSFCSDGIIPFHLQRQVARLQPNRKLKRYIESIEYVGEEECQCIYIDHPDHLYVTDDYIITHNTTIARIMTGFLYQFGYIKENKCIEIDGNFLKAGTESALKTELVVRAAYGGVLFIDEAYALMESGDGSGEQVIATLIKQMEDNRDKFILIIAGYTNEMKMLIDQNPGFESRIKEYLDFPDYDAIEMRAIAQAMDNQNNFVIDSGAFDVYDAIVARERKLKSFGNGRTVRNIIDKAIDKHTLNLAKGIIEKDKRYVLCSQDFQGLKLGTITTGVRDSINMARYY